MLSLRSRLTALTELSEDERENDSHMTSQEEEDARRHRKRERKRRRIVRELFESEKAYIHHLELIHKHFDFPLRFACIIPEDVHARLFSNLEQILRVNRQLLEELEQSSVGLAFLHLGPFLKLYSTYANDHEQALATLQEWQRKSSDFANFVRSQEERPEVRGLKLNALLITPVQRVPRYQMLLEDLLEHTSAEHHDYNDLAEATKQIRSVAWHINEHIRQHENFEKMLEIQNRLSGSAPRILAPGRLFIKEGCLKKVSRKGGRSFERMFFLFSDMLLYAKPKPLDSGRKTFTCCCVLPLKHCKIEPVFGKTRKGQQGGMFRVTCQNESLLLYSTEPGVVNEWTEELVTAVSRFNKNRRTLRKPSSNKVPMRGSGKLTPKKPDKTDTTTLKRPLESVAEETTSGSPCLKDSLHPMRLHLSALKEIDLTNCMSPRKRARNEVPLYEQTPERGEENLAMDRRDLEAVPSTPGNAKLSVTLGSMELTEESLTDGQLDMSADFLADHRDHSLLHIAPRLPIHSVVGEPDSPTESVCDSPCDTSRFYTHIKHRVKQRPKSVDNAAENCMMGFQSAYNNLKTPVTSRCVIL